MIRYRISVLSLIGNRPNALKNVHIWNKHTSHLIQSGTRSRAQESHHPNTAVSNAQQKSGPKYQPSESQQYLSM